MWQTKTASQTLKIREVKGGLPFASDREHQITYGSCRLMSLAEVIAQEWRLRLQNDYPGNPAATNESIVQWLLGEDKSHFDQLSEDECAIAKQAIEYRYRILQQRYWGIHPERAYQKLIQRLSSLFLIRSKIRTWIALSRDRQRTVIDVLQEVIQEMLQSDRHLRQQMAWIAKCTSNPRLRNNLTLASVEEYCLRPIRNQPLLVYRFVNYLRRSQRGGMTQVPTGDLVRLVSEEIASDDADGTLSLIDVQTLVDYQEQQAWEEQQVMRQQVKQSFQDYLREKLDETAAQWLELYLQGHTQDAIAQRLGVPVRQIYRLREKVSYHAIHVFTLKEQPDLVFGWLKTSLCEHNLGLKPTQWEKFYSQLTPTQRHLVDAMKAGETVDEIAQQLNLKPRQVMGEWGQIYILAQQLRTEGEQEAS